jgi:NADH dehydrogenase FAD-containing subunit
LGDLARPKEGSSMNRTRKQVVVIGGGYAGVAAAQALDSVAEVTLVDRKPVFFHRIAALRAAVDPAWTDRPFMSYDRLLRNGRSVRGTVVDVDPVGGRVLLDTGVALPFDAAVIATGSEAAQPAQFTGATVGSAAASLQEHQRRIRDARSVVVVGGGPVGIELAGEIRAVHPGKPVTLVQAAGTLLPGNTSKLGERAHDLLTRKGVTVRLGHRFDEAGHPDELVLWAVGSKPNSGWFRRSHGDKLTDRGLIRVDRHLRVEGWDSVFAIGDTTDADPKKLVLPGASQAKVAARNVRALLAGRAPETAYRPSRGEMLVVPVGPDDGVSALSGLVVGGTVTRRLKSANLFVGKNRKTLNLPRPGEITPDPAPASSR